MGCCESMEDQIRRRNRATISLGRPDGASQPAHLQHQQGSATQQWATVSWSGPQPRQQQQQQPAMVMMPAPMPVQQQQQPVYYAPQPMPPQYAPQPMLPPPQYGSSQFYNNYGASGA